MKYFYAFCAISSVILGNNIVNSLAVSSTSLALCSCTGDSQYFSSFGQGEKCIKLGDIASYVFRNDCKPLFETADSRANYFLLKFTRQSLPDLYEEIVQHDIPVVRVDNALIVQTESDTKLETFESIINGKPVNIEWITAQEKFQDTSSVSTPAADSSDKAMISKMLSANMFTTLVAHLSGNATFSLRKAFHVQQDIEIEKNTRIMTRYSYSDELKVARDYCVNVFESLGVFTAIKLQPFKMLRGGRNAWNIIAHIEGSGNPKEAVLIGAHYDSTSEKPLVRAPGAIDDGSGAAGVLTIAHAFSQYLKSTKTRPHKTVIFALFAGEEQGLVGSQYYVNHIEPEVKITSAILMDMIGYSNRYYGVTIEGTRDPAIQSLMKIFAKNTKEFAPKLEVKQTSHSFGSDHVSFQRAGIPAVLAIELDDTDYPNYHRSTDTIDNLDAKQSIDILRGIATTLLDLIN